MERVAEVESCMEVYSICTAGYNTMIETRRAHALARCNSKVFIGHCTACWLLSACGFCPTSIVDGSWRFKNKIQNDYFLFVIVLFCYQVECPLLVLLIPTVITTIIRIPSEWSPVFYLWFYKISRPDAPDDYHHIHCEFLKLYQQQGQCRMAVVQITLNWNLITETAF